MAKCISNKMLGRARDPSANGAWLNKLTEWTHEVFVLGGQRIDQKSKKDGREARGNEEREIHCFFQSSGYDKLELKHKNLVFSGL